jgi:adenylate kinase
MNYDILLFGIQWAWKWTQAKLLLDSVPNQFSYFSSWDIFRALCSSPNAIWDYLKARMETWELINNSVTNSLFETYFYTVLHENKSMLLDWFPRSIEQMDTMLGITNKHDRKLLWIQYTLPEDIAIQRMIERWRSDDTQQAIQHRIDQFYEKTQPVIDHFADHATLIKIDANESIDAIHQKTLKAISQ